MKRLRRLLRPPKTLRWRLFLILLAGLSLAQALAVGLTFASAPSRPAR